MNDNRICSKCGRTANNGATFFKNDYPWCKKCYSDYRRQRREAQKNAAIPLSQGLSLNKRLKILSRIATSRHAKTQDVIAACVQITALLNDKIRDEQNAQQVILKFEEVQPTTPPTSSTSPTTTPVTQAAVTTTTPASLNDSNINDNVLELDFQINDAPDNIQKPVN